MPTPRQAQPHELEDSSATSKSAVSRRFVTATKTAKKSVANPVAWARRKVL
jgi:hypothetical protein